MSTTMMLCFPFSVYSFSFSGRNDKEEWRQYILEEEVASDTIDVLVPIHDDYSSENESDDEAPKFVTPQREPKNRRPLLTMTLICFTHKILVPVTKVPMLFQPMPMIMIPACRRCALPMTLMLICWLLHPTPRLMICLHYPKMMSMRHNPSFAHQLQDKF